MLSNAAKFTHEGTITLCAEREKVSGVDWLTFAVSDTASDEQGLRLVHDIQPAAITLYMIVMDAHSKEGDVFVGRAL